MKYEVLSIKKQFRYHATVMATPDKWWEKYLLFKRTTTLKYQGTKGLWANANYDIAPPKISNLIDTQFDVLFGPSPLLKFLQGLIGGFFAGFIVKRPPFTGEQKPESE
jgi:hypothetical protein